MKRTYPSSLRDFKKFLHPPTSGSVQDDSPELLARGFFCSGSGLPGLKNEWLFALTWPSAQSAASKTGNNCSLCTGTRPGCPICSSLKRTIVRFTPSRSRCPVPWFGFRGTIVRVRVWASLLASLPGHLSTTLFDLQPEGIRTIVRFFYTQIFLLPQNPNKKKLRH